MSLELGLQLFSVRDELEKDYVKTLERVAEIGYKNLEFFIHDAEGGMNIGGMSAQELRGILDDLGLKSISMHVPLEEEMFKEAIEYNLELGSQGLGIGIGFFKNKDEVLSFSEKLNHFGEMCKEKGLSFYYHNHFQEFQNISGERPFDLLMENTDPSFVKFEFDTYWALRGGVDPVEYLKKLGNRCDLVHQKDLPADVSPINALEAFSEGEEIHFDNFLEFSKPEYFAEVGEGIMDIERIIQTVREIGAAKYLFVEQDLTTKNQIDSVELSYKNISKYF